jgi:23S rRNA A1618 N6-methylase RlmF
MLPEHLLDNAMLWCAFVLMMLGYRYLYFVDIDGESLAHARSTILQNNLERRIALALVNNEDPIFSVLPL